MRTILFVSILFLIFSSIPLVYSQEEAPYAGPEYCRKCHPAIYDIWQTSPHATAYTSLQEWDEAHGDFSPSFCLDCHTTSLKYNIPEVTCEICHGPKDTMAVDSGSTFCGRCHVGYQEDSAVGAHAKKLICIDCHDAHITKIFAKTSTDLCFSCHTQTYRSYLEGTHHSNEVECIDCHMKTLEGDMHTPKYDHTFYATTEICSQCHDPHADRQIVSLDEGYANTVFELQEYTADLQYIDFLKNIFVTVLLFVLAVLVVIILIFRSRVKK